MQEKKRYGSIIRIFMTVFVVMLMLVPTSALDVSAASKTPEKVTLTTVKVTKGTRVQVKWKAVKNATKYAVYYKPEKGKWKKIAMVGGSKTGYTHKSSKKYPLKAGKKYCYTVRAYNGKTAGSYDKKGREVTLPKLGKVKMTLGFAYSKNSVFIQWDKVKNAAGYKIYYKTGSGTWKQIADVDGSYGYYLHVSSTKFPLKKGKNYTYTVRAYNELGNGALNESGRNISFYSDTVEVWKSEYSYELYVIDDSENNWISNKRKILYLKTDNPDVDSLNWSSSKIQASNNIITYDDIDYKGDNCNGFEKVDGGYLFVPSFEEPGSTEMRIREDGNVVLKVEINNIGDSAAERKTTMKRIINQVTTAEMTPFEKMEAICGYIKEQNPRYPSNDGSHKLILTTDPTLPWYRGGRWVFDSASSPALLCEFAEMIGGFDKIEDGYNKYRYGTADYEKYHWYAELTVDGKMRRFEFCPSMSTGLVSSYEKVDFSNTSLFYHLA